MVSIEISGRHDLDDFFAKSGNLGAEKLPHYPYLAFVVSGDTVKVKIVKSTVELLQLPMETQVMQQWQGKWRSDFFHFTVEDVARACGDIA